MKPQTLLITLSLSSLSACMSWGTGPIDGLPTAKVRFVDLNEKKVSNTWVLLYKENNDRCDRTRALQPVAVLNGIALDHGRKDLGLPLGEEFHPDAKAEVLVRADKPLAFRMGWIVHDAVAVTSSAAFWAKGNTCQVAASFAPKENQIYEAAYVAEKGQCSLRVSLLEKNTGGGYNRTPEQSLRQLPLNECKDLHK